MRVPRDPLTDGPRAPLWTPPAASGERGGPSTARPAAGASTGAGAGRSQVLPFRRRTGLPVRRRSRLASFVRPFLTAVAIVGIPAGALWWSATSSRFALSDLEVQGSQRVSEQWVRRKLADLVGHNLVWMPLGSVERTLAGHPWVDGVEVTKELPDRLRVVVVERRPAAIVDCVRGGQEQSFWIDGRGAVIAPVLEAETPGDDLLRLRWDDVATASPERRRAVLGAGLGAARELLRSAPAWGHRITRVTVLGDEDFRLEGESLPFPLLVRFGSAGDRKGPEIASRLRRLEELLPEIRSAMGTRLDELASVDLRFRHRIVVRPAARETAHGQERGV